MTCHGTARHQTFQPCLPWPTMGLSLTMLTPYQSALLPGDLKYKSYYKTPGELQGSTDDWNLPIQDGFATRIWKEESSGLCPLFLSFSLSHLEKLNLWIHFSREQKTNLKIVSQGVPTNITMMPKLLHRAGYATHGFGKCSKTLIQNSLGFDISMLRQVAPGVLL